MDKLLTLNDVTAGYNSHVILRNINLEIHDQDFIGIIGPNGGGKTTLIKLILGLIKPFSGSIISHVPDAGLFGYLPQQSDIDRKFPIKVIDIVLSGLMSLKGRFFHHTASDKKKSLEVLEMMGISHLANNTVSELSGGQLQRVFICRALLSSPKILILDEPNTYVDNKFEHELYELLLKLNKKIAILMVSHDIGTISYYVKTIACVNNKLHYHPSNIITEEQLKAYNCPLQIITHGDIPHTVLHKHN